MSDEGKLYVGGLSYDTEEDGLAGAFGKYGAISDCIVLKDRETGRSRGFGFVTYENPEDAKDAEKGLDGTELDGRQIRVNQADRGRGRGGSYGGRGSGDRSYGGGDRSYGGGDRSYGGGGGGGDRSYGGGDRSYGDRSYSGGGRSFSRGGSSEGRSDRNQYQSSGYSRQSYRDSYE